jgi:hypothetical protein
MKFNFKKAHLVDLLTIRSVHASLMYRKDVTRGADEGLLCLEGQKLYNY